MSWDTNQAITFATHAGARLKSNCALQKVFRRFLSTQKPATTRPLINFRASLFAIDLLFCVAPAFAQIPVQAPPPPPPNQPNPNQTPGRIKVEVNLVVLHTSVIDDHGKFVDDLEIGRAS